MRRFLAIAALLLAAWLSPAARAQVYTQPPVDNYFGLMGAPCPNSNTSFKLENLNGQLVFCSPQGHAMIARGFYVMDIDLGGGLDESGQSYQGFSNAKYGSTANWFPNVLKEIQSWGMNVVMPYGNITLRPTEGMTTVKMPFVMLAFTSEYSLTNKAGWACGSGNQCSAKDLFFYVGGSGSGVSCGSGTTWCGYTNGTGVADYRDPDWLLMLKGIMANDTGFQGVASASAANKGYVLGASLDESDGLHGFGAGPDFTTVPSGNNDFRLGYMGMFLPPVSYANPHQGVIYPDGTVYMKARWNALMQAEYVTIGAMNSAWGSSFTTFNSSGTCVGSQPVTCASSVGADSVGTGTGSQVTFPLALTHTAVSKFSLGIFVNGVLAGGDGGGGAIYGPSLSGSVNYSTGVGTITFASGHAPAAGAAVTAGYVQNGFGIGTGFMDEDCRSGHAAYCGSGSGSVTINLTGIPAAVQADINALTKDTANYYASTGDNQLQAWGAAHGFTGRIPNLGPTTLGTWTAPPDRFVLQGFAGYMDAISEGGQGTFTQSEMDFVQQYMFTSAGSGLPVIGDVGLIEGEYRVSNADSPFGWPNSSCTHATTTVTCTLATPFNFSNGSGIDVTGCGDYNKNLVNVSGKTSTTISYTVSPAPTEASASCNVHWTDTNLGGYPTQAARAQAFLAAAGALGTRAYTATHTRPWVAYAWWSLQESEGEKANWGVKTNRDNAYDSNEPQISVVTCTAPLTSFNCGGELRPGVSGQYGNVVTSIGTVNGTLDAAVLALSAKLPPPSNLSLVAH